MPERPGDAAPVAPNMASEPKPVLDKSHPSRRRKSPNAGTRRPTRPFLYVASEDQAFVLHRLPMARAARALGFDVHVATGVTSYGDAIVREGFTLHALPYRRGARSPLSSLKAMLSLRRLYRRLRPAIIHHSGLQACILGGLAARGTPARQVNALTGLGYTFTSDNASALRKDRGAVAAKRSHAPEQHAAGAKPGRP